MAGGGRDQTRAERSYDIQLEKDTSEERTNQGCVELCTISAGQTIETLQRQQRIQGVDVCTHQRKHDCNNLET